MSTVGGEGRGTQKAGLSNSHAECLLLNVHDVQAKEKYELPAEIKLLLTGTQPFSILCGSTLICCMHRRRFDAEAQRESGSAEPARVRDAGPGVAGVEGPEEGGAAHTDDAHVQD